MNSQPSVLRNKQNKAAREKREERFRQVSATYEEIRDRFGTNNPEKIQEFFKAKQSSIHTLRKQMTALDTVYAELTKRSEQMRAAIEEAEYASAIGVGGNRLCAEGGAILRDKSEQLTRTRREVAATEFHQKEVAGGIIHLADVLALVRLEEEELPTQADALLRWVRDKCQQTKELLQREDFDFTTVVNRSVFAQMVAAAERGAEDADTQKKARKAEAKRQREKGGDVQARVKDRNSVKLEALKAFQAAQTLQKKKESK
jgi:hypothetical protein